MSTQTTRNDKYVEIPRDALEEALSVLTRNANRVSERAEDLTIIERSLRWEAAFSQICKGRDSELISNAAKYCEEANMVGAHGDELANRAHKQLEAIEQIKQYL